MKPRRKKPKPRKRKPKQRGHKAMPGNTADSIE
jgi:hypothetical protein